MERKKDEYIYFVKGTPINMCKFFKRPNLDPFFRIFYVTINKYGNLMKTCPLLKVFR